MARPKKNREPDQLAAGQPQINHEALESAHQALTVQSANATSLATQLGYDGPLSVAVLEDEIRFYQRRTVESLLESGKRLLLLKEITPPGEFTRRLEMLGIAERTAQRFMQASLKMAKSTSLSLLSTQVKSASAFLELVTHDEDDLKTLSEMDEVDRMSVSQVRAALRKERDTRADERETLEAKMAEKDARIDKLLGRSKRTGVEDRAHELYVEALKNFASAASALKDFHGDLATLNQHYAGHELQVEADMRTDIASKIEWMQGRLAEIANDFES